MLKKIGVLMVLASVSWGRECLTGYQANRDGICEEVDVNAKPSDEKPPRSGMPSYQSQGVHVVDIQPETQADLNRPPSCISDCFWTGARCVCNEGKAAGLSK